MLTDKQLEEFNDYANQIKHNRDNYSRAWIIEHLVDFIYEKFKISNNWIDVDSEPPPYYLPVLCYDGKYCSACWRASDGDNEFYTIHNTDNIMENVTHWMLLPESPNDK